MRLDKFLKLSRLIKRRPIAKKVVDEGKVTINDKIAKPASEVKIGDIIKVFIENKVDLKVQVLMEPTYKTTPEDVYKIIKEE